MTGERVIVRLGYAVVLLLVLGVGGATAFVSIQGAVVASGVIERAGKNKEVQTLYDQKIEKIHVKEGQLVEKDSLLVTFDETRARAEVEIIGKRLFEGSVKRLRLLAARDDSDAWSLSPELEKQAEREPDLQSIVDVQRRLFDTRRKARAMQQRELAEQLRQLKVEIEGLERQQTATRDEMDLLKGEITDLSALQLQRLVSQQRLNALRRSLATAERTMGGLISQIAAARGRIADIEFRLSEVEQTYQDQTLKMLAEVESELPDLHRKLSAARTEHAHTVARAPLRGYVHELAVSTNGGVVSSGNTLMRIVPADAGLVVHSKVRPEDIDQIYIGQEVDIRLSSFDVNLTPLSRGHVTFISADQEMDTRSGQGYYSVRIALIDAPSETRGANALLAGMPVEVFIQTNARTIMSFLMKPLGDRLARVFREG
jgi:HlyD family secretion protein